MRLRHIIIMSGITFALGGAVWLYDNAGQNLGTGEGGLPLIKANTTPVRTQPDDPGGEVIPHSDSTVFAAMSRNQNTDPSMAGLKLPETNTTHAPSDDELTDPEIDSPEFAGLNTGFALPQTPQPKVESLFTTDQAEAEEIIASEPKSQSRYVSGFTMPETHDKPVKEEPKTAENTPQTEPAQTSQEPKKAPVDKPVEVVKQVIEDIAPTPTAQPTLDQAGQAARAMEEQEKQLIATQTQPAAVDTAPQTQTNNITPTAKPPVPVAAPVAKTPQPKEETKKQAEIQTEPAQKPTQTPQAVAKPAPILADDPQIIAQPLSPQITAPAQQPAAQPSQQPAPQSSERYVIQLSSMPSRPEAERSWMQMQSMYPEALSGLSPSYVEIEIPNRGTFTRLRAGTLPRAEANARCEQIRREDPRGGGCLVIRE